MNLSQAQIQIPEQIPESLSNLFAELADLYLDYRRDKPTVIIEDLDMLINYNNFPEIVGAAFLQAFGKALENGV